MVTLNAIRRIVKTITDKPISKIAIQHMQDAVISFIKRHTKSAEELHTNRNEARSKANLPQKSRIDGETILTILSQENDCNEY